MPISPVALAAILNRRPSRKRPAASPAVVNLDDSDDEPGDHRTAPKLSKPQGQSSCHHGQIPECLFQSTLSQGVAIFLV